MSSGNGAVSGTTRCDAKPRAKALLKRFGSFAEVVHAPESLLHEIDASLHQIKLIAAAASRIARGAIKRGVALSSE
jgi:DNA repair protein RadC